MGIAAAQVPVTLLPSARPRPLLPRRHPRGVERPVGLQEPEGAGVRLAAALRPRSALAAFFPHPRSGCSLFSARPSVSWLRLVCRALKYKAILLDHRYTSSNYGKNKVRKEIGRPRWWREGASHCGLYVAVVVGSNVEYRLHHRNLGGAV